MTASHSSCCASFFFYSSGNHRDLHSFPTRRSSDLGGTAYQTDIGMTGPYDSVIGVDKDIILRRFLTALPVRMEAARSEEHTSELQSQFHLVCRLLLEKKKRQEHTPPPTHLNSLTRP